MLEIKRASAFKTDVKKIKDKRALEELKYVLTCLIEEKELDKKYCLHPLTGNYKNYMECHIRPDLLLVFRATNGILYLYRIGSHAGLFK